jgi:hypothetical protein
MPGLCGLLSAHFMRGCKRAPLVFIQRPLTVGVCARLLTRHETRHEKSSGRGLTRASVLVECPAAVSGGLAGGFLEVPWRLLIRHLRARCHNWIIGRHLSAAGCGAAGCYEGGVESGATIGG